VLYLSVMAIAVVALTNKKYDMALWVLGYLFLGWVYNAPPLRLSVRPFASIVTLGVYYAALPFLFGIFLVGSTNVNVLIFGAGLLLQRVATSVLKDYKDTKGDALHGKRTFLLTYGAKATGVTSMVLYVAGAVCLLAALVRLHGSADTVPLYAMLASVGMFMAWSVALRVRLLRKTSMQQRAALFARCFAQENYVVGLMAVWLALL
jgi:4-hydroxybenzoate polyprenyltransferase